MTTPKTERPQPASALPWRVSTTFRENNGDHIVTSETGRIAGVAMQAEAKRGKGHATEDPDGLANAAYIVWAANNAPRLEAERNALREALESVLTLLPDAATGYRIPDVVMPTVVQTMRHTARRALSLDSQENTP